MQRRELAHHLGDQIAQFLPVSDAVHERQIFLQHRRPVHTVQVAVVEEIALQPPGFGEHLAPFLARVEREGPIAQWNAFLQLDRRSRVRVHDVETVVLLDQHLLAVGGKLEPLDGLSERFELWLLVRDVQSSQRDVCAGFQSGSA